MKYKGMRSAIFGKLAKKIYHLLCQLGQMGDERKVQVFLVGGFVRDLCLGRQNWDVDVTIQGDGIAFARAMADRYAAGIVCFERFATARLILPNGVKLDISSARGESYALPGALPEVRPALLEEDLYRRDFTINAMAIGLNAIRFGVLHDPYGGRRDLKAKTIRVLHDKSFIDDPTRVFRAIRFAERFDFRLEAKTARLMKEAAATDAIARLSGPRLCNEILLLCGESHPERPFASLARLQLLRFLHPNLSYTRSADRTVRSLSKTLSWWARYCRRHPIDRQLVYLMALLDGVDQSIVEGVVARLMFSNEHAVKVRASGKKLESLVRVLAGAQQIKRSDIYRSVNGLPDEALLLCLAKISGQAAALARMKRRVMDYLTNLRRMKPLLRGDDLLRLGVKPGPAIGAMLVELLEAKLDGVVKTRRGEQSFVLRHLAETP
ncbi:MAG TPA: hypothetical protein VIR79_05930 [Nitrospira sp.]